MLIHREYSGYGLIEIILVLIFFTISLLMVVPTYRSLIAKNAMTSTVNQVLLAVESARNEAVVRGQIVTLCASYDSKHCAGEWQDGMLLMIPAHSGDNQLLRTFSALPQGTRIWSNTSKNRLSMLPTGYLDGLPARLIYCPEKAHLEQTIAIVISNTGRVREEQVPMAKCKLQRS